MVVVLVSVVVAVVLVLIVELAVYPKNNLQPSDVL